MKKISKTNNIFRDTTALSPYPEIVYLLFCWSKIFFRFRAEYSHSKMNFSHIFCSLVLKLFNSYICPMQSLFPKWQSYFRSVQWEAFFRPCQTSLNAALIHFILLISFYIPGKHQKTFEFLTFSGGIAKDQWHEMG